MAVNIGGVVAVVLFYVVMLGVGLWAARKRNTGDESKAESEDVMLAGRNIGMFVGIFTMTATWVGGGYINGTAEMVVSSGFVWCQAPIGYSISLVFSGLLFAEKMRSAGYVTMLDPFQVKYGQRVGGLLFFPALLGEVFWSAAILAALGATLSVILELDNTTAVLVSAAIAVIYTMFGGLYSVAYSDVIQLLCIVIGLVVCIPFAANHHAVSGMWDRPFKWLGSVDTYYVGYYIDTYLLVIFGGVPWQAYFQRVLSAKTAGGARLLSLVAAVGCLLLVIPPAFIGVIASATDWNKTDYGQPSIPDEDLPLVLPLVLQYLTPTAVSFFGLGAVSAAVMSSCDSTILSASSMFARNIYKLTFRPKASEREVLWVMRISILLVGALASLIGIVVTSVYALFYLCADLVYVILFPQLVCVVYMDKSNTYGSLAGYVVGLVLRIGGGESLIGFAPVIYYPYFSEHHGMQLFPFKTFAMLCSCATIISVSLLTHVVFKRNLVPAKWDVLHAVVNNVEVVREKRRLEVMGQTRTGAEENLQDMEMKEKESQPVHV